MISILDKHPENDDFPSDIIFMCFPQLLLEIWTGSRYGYVGLVSPFNGLGLSEDMAPEAFQMERVNPFGGTTHNVSDMKGWSIGIKGFIGHLRNRGKA